MDLRDDVLAVDLDPLALGRPEGDVQRGPVLGGVDDLAAKHRVDPLTQAALLGERDQQAERLVGDSVLGVVEEDAGRLGRQPLAPPRVVGEEISQVQIAHLAVMLLERPPRVALPQPRWHAPLRLPVAPAVRSAGPLSR